MTTQKTFLAALGLAALLSSSLALADHDHKGHKGHKHGGPRQDVVALEQSKISAAQAIAIAEKDTKATADNLDLELHRGSAVYEIDLHDDKQEYEIRVDAITGEITKRQSEYEDDLPRRGTITITQAIETAERETGAKVVEADLDGKRSGLVYEIELIGSDGSRHFADISADDGAHGHERRQQPAAAPARRSPGKCSGSTINLRNSALPRRTKSAAGGFPRKMRMHFAWEPVGGLLRE